MRRLTIDKTEQSKKETFFPLVRSVSNYNEFAEAGPIKIRLHNGVILGTLLVKYIWWVFALKMGNKNT